MECLVDVAVFRALALRMHHVQAAAVVDRVHAGHHAVGAGVHDETGLGCSSW